MAQKKEKLFGLLWAALFVLYNGIIAAVLLSTDIEFLTFSFWTALAFAEVSLLVLLIVLLSLGNTLVILKDWFFGYPLIRHCAIYLGLTMFSSTVFMILHTYVTWGVVLGVSLLLLTIYLVFALSCLIAKRAIQEIEGNIKEKRLFIDLLKVDAEMLCAACNDAQAKKIFTEYAELVRYSDPMSAEVLFELEKEVQLQTMKAAEALREDRLEDAIKHCKEAQLLLMERNKKCKALK
jgi:hypothetical protein